MAIQSPIEWIGSRDGAALFFLPFLRCSSEKLDPNLAQMTPCFYEDLWRVSILKQWVSG